MMRDRYEDRPSSSGVDARMIEFVAPPPPDDSPLNIAALFLKSFLMRCKHTQILMMCHLHLSPVEGAGVLCYLVVYS